MKRLSVMLIVLLGIGLLPVWAQYRTTQSNNAGIGVVAPNLLGTPFQLSGLLDASKLHMSHEFSTGYTSGGGGNSLSALYLNTMTYQVSPKFQWVGSIGYGGTALNSYANGQTGGVPMGSLGFNWQPKNNVWISAMFSRNGYQTASDRFDHFSRTNPWYQPGLDPYER